MHPRADSSTHRLRLMMEGYFKNDDTGLSMTTQPSVLTISFAVVLLASACLLALTARYLHSPLNETLAKLDAQHEACPVPVESCWIPFVGHALNLALNANSYLGTLREKYTNGIFLLKLFGMRHVFLHSPALTQTFFAQIENMDTNKVREYLAIQVFGFPPDEVDKLAAAELETHAAYKHLTNKADVDKLVSNTRKNVMSNLSRFVTGGTEPWEQQSRVIITSDIDAQQVFEASLFTLVRNFVVHMTNASFMGSDFLRNFPDFFDDIWTLDREFFKLMVPLPPWAPIPGLRQAHTARERLIGRLIEFENAMENKLNGQISDPNWATLDDVSCLIRYRVPIYRKHRWSLRARAANELALNWAANANSNSLTFWMLNRIYMNQQLLQSLREEIYPYVQVKGSSNEGGSDFELFDVDGLVNQCPLLKSCYIESLRLHTASWSFKMVTNDCVLQGRKEKKGWLLRKGDYCHAAHELHNTDPAYFEDPLVFKPDRHVRYSAEQGRDVADMGSIRPYGTVHR